MELALDFEAFAGWPLPPAPQSKYAGGGGGGGAVPLRERQGAAANCHTGGQGHRARVNFPGPDDTPLPLPHVNGGGHGYGTGGAPRFYQTNGSVETPGEAPHIRGSQMGTKAKSTHSEALGQDEGHG